MEREKRGRDDPVAFAGSRYLHDRPPGLKIEKRETAARHHQEANNIWATTALVAVHLHSQQQQQQQQECVTHWDHSAVHSN